MTKVKWFLIHICLYGFIRRMITRVKTIFMYSYTVTYYEDGIKKRRREWSHHPFTVWVIAVGGLATLALSLISSFIASIMGGG